MSKIEYKVTHLKTLDEYYEELKEIHNELGVGIATDTLIKSDLDLLRRADELVVLLEFLKQANKE